MPVSEERREESVEVSGRNVQEAIAQGLARLGAPRAEVEIEVLSEGSRGILGLLASEARVRLTWKAPPPLEAARVLPPSAQVQPERVAEAGIEVLEELIGQMGLKAKVSRREVGDPSSVTLEVTGENLGPLIGRQGQTLAALEYLTRLIVNRRLQQQSFLNVDVQGYMLRREEQLRELAREKAGEVVESGAPVALQPMSARERRIIHLELRDHPQVTTQSTGEGEERRVMVLPRE